MQSVRLIAGRQVFYRHVIEPCYIYIDNDDECCYKLKKPANLFMSRDDDRRRLCVDWWPYINTTVRPTKHLAAKLTGLRTRDLFVIDGALI